MSERMILGLMSGTSHDGVDAALISFGANGRPSLRHHCHVTYPPSLRDRVAQAFSGGTAHVCALNFELGEVFSRAALRCLKEAGASPSDVSAIASHGQTICHRPPERSHRGSTLQIGEPAVIAQRTGIKVVSDFRAADMALGGQGAPLVPLADHMLFSHRAPCCVQNIGGISNVTVVTEALQDVFAFDTGPGNSLIDEAMRLLFGKPFDRGGRVARGGRADEGLLARLLCHPYFAKKPPKSTGRETFGREMVRAVIDGNRKARAEDIVATLTRLTARSIADAYQRFILKTTFVEEVILSGGGAKNGYLVELLGQELAPLEIRLTDELGIPAEAKEAMSFAVLANETLSGRPGSLPRATGASRAAVLGKISLP